MGGVIGVKPQHQNQNLVPPKDIVVDSDDANNASVHKGANVPQPQPAPVKESTKPLVVAIDFGTTYSGFAFSFGHDCWSISSNNWQGAPVVKQKAPTCLLLNSEQQFDSFGYEAKQKYADLAATNEHTDWYFFWQFKMTLHQTKELTLSYMLKEEGGKELDALLVFSLSIKSIKDLCMSIIHNSGSGLKVRDITWVITVPAIWKESAKKFMRRAAENAGIDRDRLEIALEPEAAALYCHNLHRTRDQADYNHLSEFTGGMRYMILDCGGGTVDVSVHEVMPGNKLKELHVATGGDWGGTKVNKAFLTFLSNLIGPPEYKTFCEEHVDDYFNIVEEFESKKRSVSPESSEKVNMRIPYELQEIFKKINLTTENMTDIYKEKVSIMGDKLRIDSEVFKSFFKKAISDIVNHVLFLLTSVPGPVEAILMVGGFSDSKLLQAAVREKVQEHDRNVRIIIPIDASLCVVKGAVLYGHDPLKVALRKIPYTYGVSMTVPFERGKHPLSRKVRVNNRDMVDDVFDKHVTVGQEVRTGEATEEKIYYPMTHEDRTISIALYKSFSDNPTFVDEESCECVGTFVFDIPVTEFQSNRSRGVRVKMMFGGTDITVRATEVDGKVNEMDFGFH